MVRQLKTTVRHEDAWKFLEMCEMGKLCVFSEMEDGKRVMRICDKSLKPLAVVGERHRYMFEQFVSRRGSGDDLFSSVSQTTV